MGGDAVTVTISLQVPEEPLVSLKEQPESFARELCMLAAVKLYELGKLSSGRAAQLAGVTRVEFLLALGRYQVSPFALDAETLAQDVANA
jgi:predicted HTH domain antitoxin